MKGLNREQKKAAGFTNGIAAVIAVPGSGKTLVMMERIGNLVKRYNVQPETIIGLTFNRNAAEQMRQRLVPVLGELAQRVTLSTIHSWCHYLLRTEGRVFEIISGKEQISMIRNLMKRKRLDLSVGTILSEISLAKNNLIGVEEFRILYESDKAMTKVANIYESYEKEKALKNMILIDKSHPRVDQIVAAMFRISMAIKSLEEGEGVIKLERSQQGTEESGRVHKRYSGGHSGPGIGQDACHDGKDRKPGQAVQRAA